MHFASYCICVPVTMQSLESVRSSGRAGAYKDAHPWYLAQELLSRAREEGELLAILFVSGEPEEFHWWARIEDIDVEAFHRGTWETHCTFANLKPVASIFRPLDSVALYPGEEQLRREAIEPVRQHRQYLNGNLLRPYAIAETPAYVGFEPAVPADPSFGEGVEEPPA